MNNILNNNNRHLSINLATKEKRFKNLFNNNNPLSPWFYSSSNNNNSNNKNQNENKINNINIHNNNILNNKNNKDLYDYHYFIIKEETTDKGEKKQFYLEDKNHKINDKEKNTKIIIRPFDNVKFKEKRKFNILIKNMLTQMMVKIFKSLGRGNITYTWDLIKF